MLNPDFLSEDASKTGIVGFGWHLRNVVFWSNTLFVCNASSVQQFECTFVDHDHELPITVVLVMIFVCILLWSQS